MGAVNAFNGESNHVKCQLCGNYVEVSTAAKSYKEKGISSIVVAEDNYGEGSSREHAAMETTFSECQGHPCEEFCLVFMRRI